MHLEDLTLNTPPKGLWVFLPVYKLNTETLK